MRLLLASVVTCALSFAPASAQHARTETAQTLKVTMKNADGQSVGTVEIRQLEHGTLFTVSVENLPAGPRAFHVHETGKCDGPDFKSAGGHYNPTGAKHGYDSAGGPHAGDLPNIHVAKDGTATAEFISTRLTLNATSASPKGSATANNGPFPLLDGDGSAVMIHAHADDHRDMDSAAGRIACGVISASR